MTKSRVLLIDDLRSFRKPLPQSIELTVARTSAEALQVLSSGGEFSEVWFDHDLGGEDTINPVVNFLEERAFSGDPVPIEVCYVHSGNPVGAGQVGKVLQQCGYNVKTINPYMAGSMIFKQ